MTFFEIISLIESRGEKVTAEKVHAIYTDKHMYQRMPAGTWEERDLPLPIEPFQPLKEDK